MSSLLTLVSFEGLLDRALKSLAVMLVAWGIVVLMGRASAAWRHQVWCLAVTSLLLLPALSVALPAWRTDWLPRWSAQEPVIVPSPDAALLIDRAPSQDNEAVFAPPVSIPPAADTRPLPQAVASDANAPSISPFAWLAMAWLTGGMLSLLPLLIGLLQLVSLHRRSQVIVDPSWQALLCEAQRQLAVLRPIQLRQCYDIRVPLTWCAFRPVLLIPAEADQWPEQRRRFVMLHELAHIRRWDWLTQLVAHFACTLYWFNPLVWLAARRMQVERERACDDLVLASGARASDYAEELLTVAANISKLGLSTLVAVPMARRGALEDRLRGILEVHRSRTSVTVRVLCLGVALTAVVIAPLAMLRAAPPQAPQPMSDAAPSDKPKPEAQPAIDKSAPRAVADGQVAAPADAHRISVLDSKGRGGIAEFRVIAGVSTARVADEFEKRTGQTVVNWQQHTCHIGKDGVYLWPLKQAYDEMAIRVEADGYTPQVATWIKKANGAQHIVFMLAEDNGLNGRVLTPGGQPAAGATVALAIPGQEIVWEEGKIRGADQPEPKSPGARWQRPRLFKTDTDGKFQLPTEVDPAAVVVIHDAGVWETAYDAWKKSPEVTLQKWGRIAGQLFWSNKPGVDEEVTFSVHRHNYGYPGMIASYGSVRTDQAGTFTFNRMLPGLVQISRPFKTSEVTTSGVIHATYRHATIAAGDATPVLLGGQGRKVTGKFTGLDSSEGVTFHFHP